MGPSLAGSGRRPAPRSNFTPNLPPGLLKSEALGPGLTRTTAPTLGEIKEPGPEGGIKVESDEEVYSEQEDGVEIVDMQSIRKMDWMAPETLKRESEYKKKVKPKKRDERKPLEKRIGLAEEEGSQRGFLLKPEPNLSSQSYGCR